MAKEQKTPIGQIQQSTSLNIAPMNNNIRPMENNAFKMLSAASAEIGSLLGQQQERIDNLKIANNKEILAREVATMNNALDNAKDEADFDTIADSNIKAMKASTESRMGKRLYNTWLMNGGNNYFDAVGLDISTKKIAFNKKMAEQLASDTVEQQSYNWAYADSEEKRAYEERKFFDFIEDPANAFSELEKNSLMKKFDHDKEFGYLTANVYEKPQEVLRLLENPENFNDLSVKERESFKASARTAIKKQEDLAKEFKNIQDKAYKEILETMVAPIQAKQADIVKNGIIDIAELSTKDAYDKSKLEYVPYEKVVSLWQFVEDSMTHPLEKFRGPNGENVYAIDFKDGQGFKDQLRKYMRVAVRNVINDKVKSKTVFGRQLQLLSHLAASSGDFTEDEISDLISKLYQNDMAAFSDNPQQINKEFNVGNQERMLTVFKDTVLDYMNKNGKIPPANWESIPASVPYQIYSSFNNKFVLPQIDFLKNTQVIIDPFFFAKNANKVFPTENTIKDRLKKAKKEEQKNEL